MTFNASTYKFRSVLNLRDIGGIRTVEGASIKKGILYRSANLDKISRKEKGYLRMLGIKTIIDLRAVHESKRNKRHLNDIEVISLPLDFEKKTRERFMPHLYKKDSEKIIEDISNELYLEMLDASKPVIMHVLDILLQENQASVLIHCQAGKDRTGIIAALIQMMLGAERKAIIEEYLKSNDELLPFFRKMLLFRKIISFGFFPSSRVLNVITVRSRNIESVMDRIDGHYGGIESYLVSAGIDMVRINHLRDKLIEK